jgi:magnesium-transporting ATPase (P-type)
VEIPIEELVPGDVVHLSAGDMVPADLRLIAAKDLFVNQASVTGEALPAEKHAQAMVSGTAGVGDLTNICLMGTAVVSGSATGVIVLTGKHAYFGKLAAKVADERPLTSFDRGIRTRRLAFFGAFGFVPLPRGYWPILGLMIGMYLALTHTMKLWFHRRFGLG